jgi:hypothetical protein
MGRLVDFGIVVSALVAYFLWYLILRLVTRAKTVAPGPATLDLGDEPPAVVSLLVNGWELTEDAAESTLLDLAARGYVELRQPGNDPRRTTLHLTGKAAGDLLPFERRVLARVSQVAVQGVIPITALTFRDARQAAVWEKALRVEVVAEARRLGLSRRRFSPAMTTALSFGAFSAASVVFGALVHSSLQTQPPSLKGGLCFGVLAWFVVGGLLGGIATQYPGERDTGPGRVLAARWLGVQRWLRAQESFADLPPASVAVWDRYLPYGAALGVTRVASTVLDLGAGTRRRLWSHYGGVWRRVKVHYPRVFPHYGRSARDLAVPARKAIIRGVGLMALALVGAVLIGLNRIESGWAYVFDLLIFLTGAVLVPLGAVRLLQVLFDTVTRRSITGEVLWIEPWPRTLLGRPYLERSYLVVDDGSANQTTAWAMPSYLDCDVGDVVKIRVGRWSRRVVELYTMQRGRGPTVEFTTPIDFDDLDPPTPGRHKRNP